MDEFKLALHKILRGILNRAIIIAISLHKLGLDESVESLCEFEIRCLVVPKYINTQLTCKRSLIQQSKSKNKEMVWTPPSSFSSDSCAWRSCIALDNSRNDDNSCNI